MTLYGMSGRDARLPLYMNYWAESCGSSLNARIADCTLFVLMSDEDAAAHASWPAPRFFACRDDANELPPTVQLILLNSSAWTARVKSRIPMLQTVFASDNMLKLADYKPLYGEIFEDLVSPSKYSHWAYADPDVIFGNIGKFFSFRDDAYVTYFRLGWHEETASGQFTVLRNTPEMRVLWREGGAEGVEVLGMFHNKRRLTFSELAFGKQLFLYARLAGPSFQFSHREESFTDESGHKGRWFDFFYENGRVFAQRTCMDVSRVPSVEGILLHLWAVKKFVGNIDPSHSLHNCSAWRLPTLAPWKDEARWNISFVQKDNVLVSAEFHDTNWHSCRRPPCGCSKGCTTGC